MNDLLSSYVEQKKRIDELQREMWGLRDENNHLRVSYENIISEPYYKKAMNFRKKAKKTILYKIYSRVRYGKLTENIAQVNAETNTKEFNYDYMLGVNEYRFLKYKKYRNQNCKIDIKKIGVPYRKDFVSVVLPVYNGGDYLELSIESVLAQTYPNFELIIVNDGSTDCTAEIADKYAMLDSRIRVIHQENRKLPRTLSRGFREARGELFTWTSADNIMHPKFLEKFVDDMKKFDHTSMIYGNIRLIDENGNFKTDFGWYTDDAEHPENVMLPKSILELNTFANNYIGAAFMYRAIAANVVEDYSAYKYGIEDYDYWMKINELFTLRHASFDVPEYSYRMHSKSLTSRDRELKITENRYRQMLLDDFRRDYYLKQMCWIVETDDKNIVTYQELMTSIEKAGHKLLTREQAKRQSVNLYERFVYVLFAETERQENDTLENAFKVIVTEKPVKTNFAEQWDAYICRSDVTEEDFIKDYKGWFGIKEGQDIFAFVDSKARNRFLYELEGDEAENKEYERIFSIILSCSGNLKNLNRCIESIGKRKDMELIVVSGADVADAVDEYRIDKLVLVVSENDVTKKNAAARMAAGKYLVFLEEDCLMEQGYLEKLDEVFALNEKIAVVFGNVELAVGKKQDRLRKFLGEYSIEKDDIYLYNDWDIPSGYACAIRRDCFKMVGGFYHIAEEFPQVFCHEMMFGMGIALAKFGYYIYLAAECTVTRLPDKIEEKKLLNMVSAARFGEYHLKLNNVLPYNIWPEGLAAECSETENAWKAEPEDEWNMARHYSCEQLLKNVRSDFREKEKVDLNRDLFSRLV